MVFVNKVMAVEHVEAVPGSEVSQHMDDFTGCEENCVLEAGSLIRQESPSTSGSADDLQVHEMNVNGMYSLASGVAQLP